MTLLGTGVGENYDLEIINKLSENCNIETHLYRALCDTEYFNIINNHNKFTYFDYALEMKWFATSYEHARLWG